MLGGVEGLFAGSPLNPGEVEFSGFGGSREGYAQHR